MRLPVFLASALFVASAHAQFDLQNTHTTADLNSIHSLGGGIAWASGSNGTVLRTVDDGTTWQTCTPPSGAEHLRLHSIQGFDEKTAVAMSSDKGDLSRLYRTEDGCHTWKLVFTNPGQSSLFASLRRVTAKQIYLLGSPVDGKFSLFLSQDAGTTWFIADDPGLDADPNDSTTPSSSSFLLSAGPFLYFGSGSTAHVFHTFARCDDPASAGNCSVAWAKSELPAGSAPAHVIALAAALKTSMTGKTSTTVVALLNPNSQQGDSSLVISSDGGEHWSSVAGVSPGSRSSLAYDGMHSVWMTVGASGSEISRDGCKTWKLLPSVTPQVTRAWSSLSLPFAAGPQGAIGRLRPAALQP